jgi:molybdopterin-containing oxidoreductase family membrane subunit
MHGSQGLLAVFMYVDDLFEVLRRLKEQATRIETVYSPFRLREVDEILGKKPSIVRLLTLLGGILGGTAMVALAVYAHMSFELITSGKPVFPRVPWIIVCFEGVILLAVIFSVVAWILKGRLPRARLAPAYDLRFSEDRFGILVSCTDAEKEKVRALLETSGAEEVRDVSW